MKFPDYTSLHYFRNDYAICPNCGQLLKTKYNSDEPYLGDADEYHGDSNIWYTCRCKECKISGDGSRSENYSLDDPAAWKFPKNYEATATQKQNNYIKFLADQAQVHHNYISNAAVAGEMIKQLLVPYTEGIREIIDRERRDEIIESLGYTPNGTDTFLKKFVDLGITVQLDYLEEENNKFVYSFWGQTYRTEQQLLDLISVTTQIKDDLKIITYKVSQLPKATPEEAMNRIMEERERVKRICTIYW